MKIKRLKVLTLCVLVIMLSSCNTKTEMSQNTKTYVKISMPWLITTGNRSSDFDLICDEFNKITREKIGVEVNILEITSTYNLETELSLYEKEGIVIDLAPNYLCRFDYIPLDDLLEEYGKDIKKVLTSEQLSWGNEDGKQLFVPAKGDNTNSSGVAMRKDILDKYNIDTTTIQTIEDIDKLFNELHQQEPDLKMISPILPGSNFLYRLYPLESINGFSFATLDEQNNEIVNMYSTDDYVNYVSLFRKWYINGYLPDNLLIENVKSEELVKSGELFAFFSACKPGIEAELKISTGYEMVVVPMREPIVTYSSATSSKWGISTQSEHPVEAMKLLNLLYSDPDLINLLSYGLENTHYVINEDGTIDYPDGVNAENSNYTPNIAWFAPNQSLTYLWSGYPISLWDKTEKFDLESKRSVVFDFFFDDTLVKEEITEIQAIVSRYNRGLGLGMLDPEVYLPKMQKELNEAGIEKVLEQMNIQYNAWIEENSHDNINR